jgi:hypothetical protein
MDELFLASHNREKCWEGTKELLAQLSEAGYKVSWKKEQVCQQRYDTSELSSQKDNAPWVQRGNRPSAPSHRQRPKGRSENSWEWQDSVASGYVNIQAWTNHSMRP